MTTSHIIPTARIGHLTVKVPLPPAIKHRPEAEWEEMFRSDIKRRKAMTILRKLGYQPSVYVQLSYRERARVLYCAGLLRQQQHPPSDKEIVTAFADGIQGLVSPRTLKEARELKDLIQNQKPQGGGDGTTTAGDYERMKIISDSLRALDKASREILQGD